MNVFFKYNSLFLVLIPIVLILIFASAKIALWFLLGTIAGTLSTTGKIVHMADADPSRLRSLIEEVIQKIKSTDD